MRDYLLRCALSAALLLGLTACPSFTTMHTARPIEPGTNEIGISPVVTDFDGVKLPTIEVQLRHGINDMMDFGVRYTFPLTFTADFNIAVVNTDAFALSIDPTLSPIYFSADDDAGDSASFFMLWAFLPVVADVVNLDFFTLTLSAKAGLLYATATSESIDSTVSASGVGYVTGGSVGMRFQLGQSFAIMPEFSALYAFEGKSVLWTGAIGFLF